MTQTEALRLALEALEEYCEHGAIFMPITVRDAIKAALEAKDEPAPVAKNEGGRITWMIDDWPQNCLLYTHSPQRTWVGLTDEDEIDWEEGGNLKDLVKAIEAKLKQKNGNA